MEQDFHSLLEKTPQYILPFLALDLPYFQCFGKDKVIIAH